MKLFNLTIIAIALFGISLEASALEMETAVVIESGSPRVPDQLVITGRSLNIKQELQITIGGTPVEVVDVSRSVILANIPLDILPGNYVLIVWSQGGRVREDEMDVTIGAVGPQGPEGAEGPEGPRGARGSTGRPGATGPRGEQGPPGPRGERGAPGMAGRPGANGINGSNGLNCWDTNANGAFDGSEDTDGDGTASAADCRGLPGVAGGSCTIVQGPGVGEATLVCPDGSSATFAAVVNEPPPPPEPPFVHDYLVVAYINDDGADGFGAGDTLIAGIHDTNGDGVVSVGDEIETNVFPMNSRGDVRASVSHSRHVIDVVHSVSANGVVVMSSYVEFVEADVFWFRNESNVDGYIEYIHTGDGTDWTESSSGANMQDRFGSNGDHYHLDPTSPSGPSISELYEFEDTSYDAQGDSNSIDVDIFLQ